MDLAKRFELLALTRNTNVDDIYKANVIVEDHISGTTKLKSVSILTGGTAIDFAMRLKGSQLYPDETMDFNDYDFLNPDGVVDAYKLGMELHKAELADVTVFNAQHILTMKVTVGGTCVADDTYMPEDIFNNIMTLTYKIRRDGRSIPIRLVHPMYQVINMHTAIAYPWRNAPREVYSQRISKDITRYNMLWNLYIKDYLKKNRSPDTVSVSVAIPKSFVPELNPLYIGLLAHANILKKCKFTPRHKCELSDDVLHVDWIAGIPVPIDIVIPEPLATERGIVANYHKLVDWFPQSYKETGAGFVASMFISKFDLIPVVQKYACIQHTLMYFAVQATISTPKVATLWWDYYHDCLDALNELCPDPLALFGTDVWPDRKTKVMSESVEFWNKLTAVNIEEGAQKTEEKSAAMLMLDTKPSSANLSSRNIDERMIQLMEWDYSSEFFQIDGSAIKANLARDK
jgi:hypothetical protein